MTAFTAPRTAYKVQGQSAAGVAITTKDIYRWADGSIRYTPTTGGEPVVITDPNALRLLADILGVEDTAYP